MPKKGKSYHNFMEKKFYHPTSFRNLERVWMRKQELKENEKKREDRITNAKRENEEMETRILMGDKKAKMGVAFLYDMPPGLEEATTNANNQLMRNGVHQELLGQGPHGTNKHAENQVPQYKFEWQKHAPRAKYLNDVKYVDMMNTMPTDKPFGIEVRNVMCIKCKVWGHCATDRDCPYYGQALKDIPERAADLAEKRKYLAAKYGESLGDDLEELNRLQEHEKIMASKSKRSKLEAIRKSGVVTDEVALKKKFKSKNNTKSHTKEKYELIVDSDDDGKQEQPSSESSSSESESEEEVVWTAEDRERIMLRMAEIEAGTFKKESKVKKEAKREKKVKKEKKKKKKKDKKRSKRERHASSDSDDWEEAKGPTSVKRRKSSDGEKKEAAPTRESYQRRGGGYYGGGPPREEREERSSYQGRSSSDARRPELYGDRRRNNPFYNAMEEEKIKRRRRL